MNESKIIDLLTNSGLEKVHLENGFVSFQDPSCVFAAFDKFLGIAWTVILIFVAIMLLGWALLYIKNGFKVENILNNFKNLILILAIASLVKPIVNIVYGDDLFAQQCEIKKVSLDKVNELLEMREKTYGDYDNYMAYENFEVIDSGVYWDVDYSYSTESDSSVFAEHTTNQSNSTTSLLQPNSQSNIASIEYAPRTTIYILKSGEKIKRTGGSAAWRNNNPGNIRKSSVSKWLGAVGETESWAVFADEESGLRAIVKLLRSKNYRNLTLTGAIHRWAPAADNNRPVVYTNTVSKKTGISKNAVIKDLSDEEMMKIARAIQSVESWQIGKEEKI